MEGVSSLCDLKVSFKDIKDCETANEGEKVGYNFVGDGTGANETGTTGEGKFVVATNCPFSPFEYVENGKIYGVDMEIAAGYAEKMGLELVIKNIDFDAILPALDAGYADIGMAGMTVTADRAGYLFTDKGVIILLRENVKDEDALMETALEAGAADFVASDDCFEIYTEPDDLYSVKEAIEAAGYEIESAENDKIPSTYVTLETEDDIKHMNLLLENLEDNDDVMNVYHNWENCD
jgi:hypothetical protein